MGNLRGRTGKRVLAVGAGTLLIGALGAGPAYAGSDHDDYYYSFSSDDCGDYRYSWYYEHGYDYDEHWDDRWDRERDDDRDDDRDDRDESRKPTTPPVVTPPVVTPPVITPTVEVPPLLPGLPGNTLGSDSDEDGASITQQTAPKDDTGTSPKLPDTTKSGDTSKPGNSSTPKSSLGDGTEVTIEPSAAVTRLDDPDPRDDEDHDDRWDDDHHYSSGHYSYRVVVKCYEDVEKKHRWYEHRPVGKVEATKVRTVPKGGVDTGN